MRVRSAALSFALITSLLLPSASVAAPQPTPESPQPTQTAAEVQPDPIETGEASSTADSTDPSSSPAPITVSDAPTAESSEPQRNDSAATVSPSPSETEPSASPEQAPNEKRAAQQASNDDPRVNEIQVGNTKVLIRRVATGTGHGTKNHCAINSGNTDLFPDGNSAGEPADDSAADEYVCYRDTVQYQIEFNFGSQALDAPEKVAFKLQFTDQGVSGGTSTDDYRPYTPIEAASQICPVAPDGSYTVTRATYTNLTRSFDCAFEFQPGVSGSVKLPAITMKQTYQGGLPTHLKPIMSVAQDPIPRNQQGEPLEVPPTTFLFMPMVDVYTEDIGQPRIEIVDGVPGMFLGHQTRTRSTSFDANKWDQNKGVPSTLVDRSQTYQIGFYESDTGVDNPQPLPEGAKVVGVKNNSTDFIDVNGDPIEPVRSGNLHGLWLPFSVYQEKLGIGIWSRYIPKSIHTRSGQVPNFYKEEAWDPGTDEACSFNTGSLGMFNVGKGPSDAANNNCFVRHYGFGQYTTGASTKKLANINGNPDRYFPQNEYIVNELIRAQGVSQNEDYALCDVWDAPEQTARKKEATQRLLVEPPPPGVGSPSGVITNIPVVSIVVGPQRYSLPEGVWEAQYASSDISLAGGASDTAELPSLRNAVQQRCQASDGWTTDPSQLGADRINTVRFVINREKLDEFFAEKGYTQLDGFDPETQVRFWVVGPHASEIPEQTEYVRSHDHYANVLLTEDRAKATFVVSRHFRTRTPTSSLVVLKRIKKDNTTSTNYATVPGETLTFESEYRGAFTYRADNDPSKYRYDVIEELPRCIDGDPTKLEVSPSASGNTFTPSDYEIIPAVGDPCYESGPEHIPAKVKFSVDATPSNPDAAHHHLTFFFRYDAKLQDVMLPGTINTPVSNATFHVIKDDGTVASEYDRTGRAAVTVTIVPGSARAMSRKDVVEDLVRTGQDVNWTLTFMNSGSNKTEKAEWIDVLPYQGDSRESSLASAITEGSQAISDVRIGAPKWSSVEPKIPAPENVPVKVAVTTTDPQEIVADPAHASNKDGGSTEWCWISDDNDCADQLANATALRVELDELPAYGKLELPITASTKNMRDGAKLVNNLGVGRVQDLSLEVPKSPTVTTDVYDLLIDGIVWYDTNASREFDEGEMLLKDVVVELVDADGSVVRTTTTDENGYYYFGQGLDPEQKHPGLDAEEPWFLVDGTYTTRVKRDDGVILAEWDYTFSGNNPDGLNGTSKELELGRESTDIKEFDKYKKADFGLHTDSFISWTKVDEDSAPLAGATFEVSVEGEDPFITVTDNDDLDLDPADGVIKVKVDGPGTYTVTETQAPDGYEGTEESLTGEVEVGAHLTELGELVNTRIPEEEPTPTETGTDEESEDPPGGSTDEPSGEPSEDPTDELGGEPSDDPTDEPSETVTESPSTEPSATATETASEGSTPAGEGPTTPGADRKDEALPRTGSQLLIPIGLAAILLTLGGGALWFRRRQAEL